MVNSLKLVKKELPQIENARDKRDTLSITLKNVVRNDSYLFLKSKYHLWYFLIIDGGLFQFVCHFSWLNSCFYLTGINPFSFLHISYILMILTQTRSKILTLDYFCTTKISVSTSWSYMNWKSESKWHILYLVCH